MQFQYSFTFKPQASSSAGKVSAQKCMFVEQEITIDESSLPFETKNCSIYVLHFYGKK